jgi:NAD(P)-dependent dehydrogenase (short-subunit alcohol dehydrogenase family)
METLRFDGRVAIVTGGGSGIGEAAVNALAARGAKVVVTDFGCDVPGDGSDRGRGEAVVSKIIASGGEAVAHWGDIGVPGVAEDAVSLALKTFGRIDIVVSNAAIERLADFYDFTRQDIYDHLNVDLLGAWSICRAAWPHFARQNHGRIVMTGSSSFLGGIKGVPYALAKGGLVSFSRSLSGIAKLSNLNIKSNLIAPYAHTRMWTHPQYGSGPEVEAYREEAKRLFPASGIAPTILVLAHEACPASGQIYGCTNGKVQRFFFASTPGIEKRDLTPEHLLANWETLDEAGPWSELLGTSMDVGTPFMARAKAVLTDEA